MKSSGRVEVKATKVEVRLWWRAATSAYLHDYRKVMLCL